MQETFGTVLENFGAFGLALLILGTAAWAVWRKIIEPQQKEAKEDRNKHIGMLDRIIENHDKTSKEHIDAEKENIKVLQELNSKINSHNEKMKMNHDRILDEVKREKK